MPSLFRFLFVIAALGGGITAGLYVLATRFEPEVREEIKTLPPLKIRKE